MERGAVEPSLASLRKVSEFLGVSPNLLVDQVGTSSCHGKERPETNYQVLTHPSEEIVILLRGEVDMVLGETSYHLNAGDSLVVGPNMPHRTINTGETPAILFFSVQF